MRAYLAYSYTILTVAMLCAAGASAREADIDGYRVTIRKRTAMGGEAVVSQGGTSQDSEFGGAVRASSRRLRQGSLRLQRTRGVPWGPFRRQRRCERDMARTMRIWRVGFSQRRPGALGEAIVWQAED